MPGGAGSFPKLDIDYTPVPEPGAWLLLGTAISAVGLRLRRRRGDETPLDFVERRRQVGDGVYHEMGACSEQLVVGRV
jgi:hypothetical protein